MNKRVGRALRYILVGLVTNGSAFALFLLLVAVGVAAVLANAICYLAAFTAAYFGHRRYSYRSTSAHRQDMMLFIAAHVIGFTTSVASMVILLPPAGPALAQFCAMGASAVAIFLSLEVLGFARPGSQPLRSGGSSDEN